MSAVVEFISDAVETVVDAVGDVVETVGDFVGKAVETVGNAVEAVIENPLPVLLSVAGTFVGIPPMVTSAAITAAQGGDLEDIVLSAGTAYFAPTATNAISSTLSSTIGDAIINETISDVVVDGISKGLVNGTISEVRGGDFDDGFAGGFTGTVVGAGVGEVSDFVSDNVLEDMPDMGKFGDIAEKALTSGLTAEITGRGSFDTAFTNSMINGTANLGADYISSSIDDQFKASTTTELEIVRSEEGDEKDRELLTAELDDSWANTSGVAGTGAGIPDELVDEVQVSDDGQDTRSTQEDPLMVESMSEDAIDTDISGYSSPTDYLQVEAEEIAPTEDVSDLAVEYGEELPTNEPIVAGETIPTDELFAEVEEPARPYKEELIPTEQPIVITTTQEPVEAEVLPTEELPLYEEKPVGGLNVVAKSPDVYEGVTDTVVKPQAEDSAVDVAGEPGIGMKTTGLGSLAAGLAPAVGGKSLITGALNQILKPAIRQGITKTLRGTPSKPAAKKPTPAPAPSRMSPTQLAAARVNQTPVTPSIAPKTVAAKTVPPKKKNVATLTPVTNIAGLTSLLKSKG